MDHATETQLLVDLRENSNQLQWSYFYNKYANFVTRFAQLKGVSHEDTGEILQETMLDLYTSLPTFRYDPSKGKFRNFVLTIASRRCSKYFRRKLREPIQMDPMVWDKIVSKNESDPETIDPTIQLSSISTLLESLLERNKIQHSSYLAYKKYALENQKPSDLAKELAMSIGQIYRIKNRINSMLKKELEKSDEEDEQHLVRKTKPDSDDRDS